MRIDKFWRSPRVNVSKSTLVGILQSSFGFKKKRNKLVSFPIVGAVEGEKGDEGDDGGEGRPEQGEEEEDAAS